MSNLKAVCVLDYGIGNIRSVGNALSVAGAQSVVSRDGEVIERSDGLIIPGVGSFPYGMALLRSHGLVERITRFIESGRPVLGICLGMQVLFERGNEFELTEGIGYVPGQVSRVPVDKSEGRLPHIAWTPVEPSESGARSLFAGLDAESCVFYFVHSYAATDVPSQFIAGTSMYCGQRIIAAVRKANVWGTQFHPEKSGPNGLRLLSNFVAEC